MDIRSVQRTGDMHYMYLPTSWCRKYRITSKSKVGIEETKEGSLTLHPQPVEKKPVHLRLSVSVDDQRIIHKLIVASYINPIASFEINLEKGMDFSKVLDQKKLISLESVELDQKAIRCTSAVSVNEPDELLKTMLRKIKNLLLVMRQSYDAELINRYEEEIDRTKMLIDKAVIDNLTFHKNSRCLSIDLFYIAMISKELERLVDHLIILKPKERQFFAELSASIDMMKALIEGSDNRDVFGIHTVIGLLRKVVAMKESRDFDKESIRHSMNSAGDVLLDWAVTREIGR